MTEALYATDAYARSIQATVVEVRPGDGSAPTVVVLDRTVFFPGGGGQPADRGLLRSPDGRWWPVPAALRVGPEVGHELAAGEASAGAAFPAPVAADREAATEPPAVGERVVAELDWPRRYALMRTHTALHALCGVVWRDYRAQVTGGNMEPGAGRMDFEFETMSGELVGRIEAAVNEELAAARDVRVRILPRDEAFAIPDLIRTKINLLPAGISEVRTIEIVGLDLQADGGTHVANTREVGRIRVTGYESKGRINKRIRIVLGS